MSGWCLNGSSMHSSLLLIFMLTSAVLGQLINRAPHFIPVTGDMSQFSLLENTIVGTPVYQLKGDDPENGKLYYSISGQYFSVDKMTGVVTLIKPLDREKEDIIEVIISITDEDISGFEPNTISLRRQIPIIDFNDNSPVFMGRPYSARISESAEVGTEIQIVPEVIITDNDIGNNADIHLYCYSKDNLGDTEACHVFNIETEKIAEGQFLAKIFIKRQLDFESRSSFRLGLQAVDGAVENPLSALATISIDIIDVQDQPPIFINAPYSATVPENSPPGMVVMDIFAKDGDTGNSRPIVITIEGDTLGYFDISSENGNGEAKLITSDNLLDREHPRVLQNGGVYSFFVKATEFINNEVPSDYSVTQITIVITDTDDHKPVFNNDQFNVSIPENIEVGTQIPGLSIYVEDNDLSVNSRYNLTLRNVFNSENVFTVSPPYGEGRTPIAIKVINASKLDYDVDDDTLRSLNFDIIAIVDGEEVSSTRVNLKLLDTNDNPPIFEKETYKVNVLEDVENGFKISEIKATDKDSGAFGKLEYILTGFGADHFKTEKNDGGLFVNNPLDYEKQKSYSLTMVAKDGGGKVSTVNVLVEVQDVNDNAPVFEYSEYSRTIRDGAVLFEPQLVVRATDRDGPDQGGGSVVYSIESDNSISNSGNIFTIDDHTGEIKIVNPVDSMDTPRGQYEILVRATDKGYPPHHNDTRVFIRVGVPGNQRPIFKGNYNSFISPKDRSDDPSMDILNYDFGPMNYKASIHENSPHGSNVSMVVANDPDGLDQLLTYHIVGGAKDNFIIDERSGLITVSPEASLDRDTNPDHYDIIVTAVDSGTPVPETATTTVFVTIIDVNDKPPKFNLSANSAYVSERAKIGKAVFNITATDTDVDSDLKYSIIEPIKALSRTGVHLKSIVPYNYKTAFRIDEKTGEIFINNTLDYNMAAVIILTIKAEDVNAVYNKEDQFAVIEVTLYIQSFSDNTPQFTNDGWTSTNQKIFVKVDEEEPLGSTLFVLSAEDPISGHVVTNFKVINSETDLMQVDPQTGQVLLTKRLDYESLEDPNLTFTVKATSNDGSKYNTAVINIEVQNINDNAPEFKLKMYKTSIPESSKYPDQILTVEAIDMDAVLTKQDESRGYSDIRYSLSGQNSNLFVIDDKTGVIQVAKNKTLDRERQSVLRLDVGAADIPNGSGVAQQRTSVPLIIDVLDVNDNPPSFSQASYLAVVPENVNIGKSVVNMTAQDPDEGLGGEIKYELIDEGDANGLFIINTITGEIKTKKLLAGKGRADAYVLRVRGTDGGGLYGDTSLSIYIGDVSANDGVPLFIKPTIDQIATVSENATIGSAVFQVVASDPDDPSQPSGILTYRLQEANPDLLSFTIDPNNGLITTKKQLDREKISKYELILLVSDKGEPPQTVTRVLQVNVTDIDDHKPRFIRAVDDSPITINTEEEQLKGTVIGEIAAVDEDIGENGAIDYKFISGNELGIFSIKRTDDNKAIISIEDRIDREASPHYLLSVLCFKKDSYPKLSSNRPYNRLNPAEVQVLVKVIDVDDHLPEFTNGNLTIGVRLNAPIGSRIAQVHARDLDASADLPKYSLLNVTFSSLLADSPRRNATGVFMINEETGEITSKKSLIPFVEGSFRLAIRANNTNIPGRQTDAYIQMFIVRDRDLLKFIFRAPPTEVRKTIPQFSSELETLLAKDGLALHLFDAQVLEQDNTLDFSSTSSCFQLTKGQNALTPNEMEEALAALSSAAESSGVYARHLVAEVNQCGGTAPQQLAHAITKPHIWLLVLAALLVIAGIVSACSVCCLHQKYKRQSRKFLLSRPIAPPPPPASSMSHPRIYSEPYYST